MLLLFVICDTSAIFVVILNVVRLIHFILDVVILVATSSTVQSFILYVIIVIVSLSIDLYFIKCLLFLQTHIFLFIVGDSSFNGIITGLHLGRLRHSHCVIGLLLLQLHLLLQLLKLLLLLLFLLQFLLFRFLYIYLQLLVYVVCEIKLLISLI